MQPCVKRRKLSENVLNTTKCNENVHINEIPTKTAAQLYLEEEQSGCILSLIEDLDVLLKNEIVPGSIVELAGLPGCGKTQICLHLCASVQMPKSFGGANGDSLYISTNANFCRERLEAITMKCINKFNRNQQSLRSNINFKLEDMLKRIHFVSCDTFFDLMACVSQLDGFLIDKNIRIIVIDSLAQPLRLILPLDRTPKMAKLLNTLRLVGNKHKCAVLITNDMTTRIKNGEYCNTPAFGDSYYHIINTRIILSTCLDSFKAQLVKGRYQEPKSVTFKIS